MVWQVVGGVERGGWCGRGRLGHQQMLEHILMRRWQVQWKWGYAQPAIATERCDARRGVATRSPTRTARSGRWARPLRAPASLRASETRAAGGRRAGRRRRRRARGDGDGDGDGRGDAATAGADARAPAAAAAASTRPCCWWRQARGQGGRRLRTARNAGALNVYAARNAPRVQRGGGVGVARVRRGRNAGVRRRSARVTWGHRRRNAGAGRAYAARAHRHRARPPGAPPRGRRVR